MSFYKKTPFLEIIETPARDPRKQTLRPNLSILGVFLALPTETSFTTPHYYPKYEVWVIEKIVVVGSLSMGAWRAIKVSQKKSSGNKYISLSITKILSVLVNSLFMLFLLLILKLIPIITPKLSLS